MLNLDHSPAGSLTHLSPFRLVLTRLLEKLGDLSERSQA